MTCVFPYSKVRLRVSTSTGVWTEWVLSRSLFTGFKCWRSCVYNELKWMNEVVDMPGIQPYNFRSSNCDVCYVISRVESVCSTDSQQFDRCDAGAPCLIVSSTSQPFIDRATRCFYTNTSLSRTGTDHWHSCTWDLHSTVRTSSWRQGHRRHPSERTIRERDCNITSSHVSCHTTTCHQWWSNPNRFDSCRDWITCAN